MAAITLAARALADTIAASVTEVSMVVVSPVAQFEQQSITVLPGSPWVEYESGSGPCRPFVAHDLMIVAGITDLPYAWSWIEGRVDEIVAALLDDPSCGGTLPDGVVVESVEGPQLWSTPTGEALGARVSLTASRVEAP